MTDDISPKLPDLRASHEDRDRVVEQLRDAAGDGRLTLEELDERLEKALSARTESELTALVSDLPVSAAAAPPVVKDLVRLEVGSSSVRREGQWVVPRAMEVMVSSGSVRLDLTSAVITSPTLQITAAVKSGALVIITKPGIVVDTDGVSVKSGAVKVRTPKSTDPAPPTILRVEVVGSVSSGALVARPARQPRRSFWAWLRRRPRS